MSRLFRGTSEDIAKYVLAILWVEQIKAWSNTSMNPQ